TEYGIITVVDHVVRYAGMIWLLLKNWFQDLAAFALIGKGLVRFGGSDSQRERVENSGLRVIRVCGLQSRHFLFKGLGVRVIIFAIVLIDLIERGDVRAFAECGALIRSCNLICLLQSGSSAVEIAVVP